MIKSFLFMLFLVSFCSYAQMDISSFLKGQKIDKAKISKMIDQLKTQGVITADQAAKAKSELSGLKEEDISKLQKKALDKIKKNPDLLKQKATTDVISTPKALNKKSTSKNESMSADQALKYLNQN